MTDVQIKPQNIMEPPEKVLRMYEAVHGFMIEGRDLVSVKVVDITSAAGIGKGTAYEYFSSKEEIIASAMAYEYKNKITELVARMFRQQGFKNRIMNVMDWICENQEYNQLFSHIFRELLGEPQMCAFVSENTQQKSEKVSSYNENVENSNTMAHVRGADITDVGGKQDIMQEGTKYITQIVTRLMDEAYAEGLFTETDVTKRNIIVMSGMIQYGSMLMMSRHHAVVGMTDAQLREFIYTNMIKCLN